jgi:hypothetical protein
VSARRSFTSRRDECCMCRALIFSTSATTTDPEAPEMIELPAGASFGQIAGPGEPPRLLFTCSRECLLQLLREEP